MMAENSDQLRARVGELENELSSKGSDRSSNSDGSGGAEEASRLHESSEERAEVMHGLLKELRAELMHKEEVRENHIIFRANSIFDIFWLYCICV